MGKKGNSDAIDDPNCKNRRTKTEMRNGEMTGELSWRNDNEIREK